MKIKKAIIPVAGFGTRFLPATKAQPKEMLPIVDKPIIQYLVEEAVAAGIEEIIFITGRGKRAIEDHFDNSFELEHNLVEKNKLDKLQAIYKISNMAKFTFVRQPKPLGDGEALLRAKHLIGDEPVAVLFGDDIVDSEKPCIGQLIDVFYKYESPILALMRVPKEEVSSFGVVDGVKVNGRIYEIKNLVEKPKVEEAPSDLIIVGKYVITPAVFDELEKVVPGKDGEIRLADAFSNMLGKKAFYGYEFEGKRYDCGSKLGFLEATVNYALKHPEVKDAFRAFLKEKNL
ncbi:MAG: UTP--glucose-1-phosphate uridylyltransferase GalU [Candidatus Pacebacteria bacterium]|nr:UTP--glucose-1-phosphate uridylyltransferase GalU [Candidatus Paceibacterota bacterium]